MLCHVLISKLPEVGREGAGRESRGHTGRWTTKTGNIQPLLRDGDCGSLNVKFHTRRYLELRSSPLGPGVKVKAFKPLGPACVSSPAYLEFCPLLSCSIRLVFLSVAVTGFK